MQGNRPPRRRPTASRRPQPPPSQGQAPEVPIPVAVPPGGGSAQLSAAKAAALQEVQSALDAARQAQQSGDFAEYGQALQRLDDAMTKYTSTK